MFHYFAKITVLLGEYGQDLGLLLLVSICSREFPRTCRTFFLFIIRPRFTVVHRDYGDRYATMERRPVPAIALVCLVLLLVFSNRRAAIPACLCASMCIPLLLFVFPECRRIFVPSYSCVCLKRLQFVFVLVKYFFYPRISISFYFKIFRPYLKRICCESLCCQSLCEFVFIQKS